MSSASQQLVRFCANLSYESIPAEVLDRCEDLLLDTLGSILAGANARAVKSINTFAQSQGPNSGPSEVLGFNRSTSPYFASFVNAAAAHMVEQDDVHNGSVFHPAAVVFPPVLAVAQELGSSGKEILTACVAGYEAGIRIGESLGRSHYKIFHTTATAGTLASAIAVAHLLKLNEKQTLNAFGSAGTQAAGLWEFLRDAADSKQLHTAKAASNGLLASFLAKDGFTGAQQILEGPQGMATGMSTDADMSKLTDGLGSRWALIETSFKFHASCRHTHPAADALQKAMQENQLHAEQIKSVITHVHQAAIDVLGNVTKPETVHQSKFSMGTVLALIALNGKAGLSDFDDALGQEKVAQFREKVSMELDQEVDQAYPNQWIGKVTVYTHDGQCFKARVDEPKGDPGNTLSRSEIEDKFKNLANYGKKYDEDVLIKIIDQVWDLRSLKQFKGFLN